MNPGTPQISSPKRTLAMLEAVIANVAAPLLHELAVRVRSVVQFGTFENDMVTYRIKTGRGASALFTRIGMQLEVYCSGIGKVLLANLPAAEREAYLAGGPFVALTARTIVEPARLREQQKTTRATGFFDGPESRSPDNSYTPRNFATFAPTILAALSTPTVSTSDRMAVRV